MAEKLELSLLGPVVVTQNGEPISGQIAAKSQALLFYLAVTGQPHSREKLAGLLWGDKSETSAKANLRKALSNLGQLVGNALMMKGERERTTDLRGDQMKIESTETAEQELISK